MAEYQPLRLQARDTEDLAVISAILQDAVVSCADMGYVVEDRRFVLVVNRFIWESCQDQRVLCGVRFEHVQRVQYRDLDIDQRDRALEILAVQDDAVQAGCILIHFSGGGCIRLEIGEMLCLLEDRAAPRRACGRPAHKLETDGRPADAVDLGNFTAQKGACNGA